MSTSVETPEITDGATGHRRDTAAAAVPIAMPVAESLSTLEVRWISPGRRPDELLHWLKRFPVGTETREDLYFVHPHTGGMSVKVRGSSLVEFKLHQDDRRMLDVPGLPPVRVQACEKWSFHLASGSLGIPAGGEWMRIRKDRVLTRLSSTARPTGRSSPRRGNTSGCEVELTDFEVDDEHWWTLALEASGSSTGAWHAIRDAATALLADGLPARIHLRSLSPRSYGEWLRSVHPVG